MQKDILNIILELKINQRELKKLQQLFEKYDTDKSGLLSKDEVRQMQYESKMENYNDLDWLRYIEYCDFDGNNEIDKEEFLFGYINSKVKYYRQNIK